MFISAPPSSSRDKDAESRSRLYNFELAEVAALGEGLPETWFDYNEVPEAKRAELREIAGNIKNTLADSSRPSWKTARVYRARRNRGHGNLLPGWRPSFFGQNALPVVHARCSVFSGQNQLFIWI